MNELERYFRVFAVPGFLVIVSIIVVIVLTRAEPPAMLAQSFHYIAAAVSVVGLGGWIWLAWRAWVLIRWENGELVGDCHNCGGAMRELKGRWGEYRKCMMCGMNRSGPH